MSKILSLDNNKELEELILSKAAKQFYSRGEKERFDLFPFYAILVSTGTNKNTDHFDPIQLWRARHSPADKPVNIGHKQTKIIGHIIDNIVVGEDLKPVPEDTDEADLPYKLHVVMAGVVYKIWEDPHVQAEVDKIIQKVSKGQTFVSMECLFRGFSFLLTNASTGEQRLLPRNDKTSGLTKFLRQYKGPGKIHDYSLARVLEDITFSAVGIVDKPANPDSIISANLDLFSNNFSVAAENLNDSVYINLDISRNGDDLSMSDKNTDVAKAIEEDPKFIALNSDHNTLVKAHEVMRQDNDYMHKHIAEIKLELTAAKNSLALAEMEKNKMADEKDKVKANDGDADDEAMAAIKAENESLKKENASLKETLTSVETTKASFETKNVELVTANDAMTATINEFKKASRHTERSQALMEADASLSRDQALEKVKAFDEMSDGVFAGMCQTIKGYASRAPKEVTPETILASAKTEPSPPLGAKAENEYTKTSADIKNFLTSKKKGA